MTEPAALMAGPGDDWRERVVAGAVRAACLLAVLGLLAPVAYIVMGGAGVVSVEFLTTAPTDAGRAGGIASILVSTAVIVAISLLATLPLALGTALLLTEFMAEGSRATAAIKGVLDVLAGVPSVVFGLFGLALFCRQLGLGYSLLSGGLTLACMILPTVTQTFCTAFESADRSFRNAAVALGISKTATLLRITIPVALPGLTAGIVLGLARALAETAVLLFTSGYSDRMPSSIMDSGRSISVHIYELATNVPGAQHAAYGSALVLLALLALISVALAACSSRLRTRLLA